MRDLVVINLLKIAHITLETIYSGHSTK